MTAIKTQTHITYYTLFFSQVLSSHFNGVWITKSFYCRVVKRHVTVLQIKITWADATAPHRGCFAGAAGADTWAGHSWDRNTALVLWSSCAWACPVELMQVNTCAWCMICNYWLSSWLPGSTLHYMPLCTVNTFTVLEISTKDFPFLFYN